MKRALLLLAALAGCGADATPREMRAENGFFRDRDGRAVILRGVNVSGEHKFSPYLDFHDAAAFTKISADWGMNAVRFLLVWAAVEPTRGAYDAAYLAKVRAKLDLAHAAGLYVILDMHQDVYGEGFSGGDGAPRWTCDEARYAAFQPRTPWFLSYTEENVMACVDGFWNSADLRGAYVAAWREVARTLADHPAVIGFDPMNEPYWGSTSLEDFDELHLAPLYRDVTAAVRAHAPGWIAFAEPASSRNLGFATNLPALPDNAAYSPHLYDSAAEGGAGFDPSHREQLEGTMGQLATEAASFRAPLWIGEYGGVAANPGIVEYMDTIYDAAGTVAASAMYWDYSRNNGYGLLDPTSAEKTNLTDVIARPFPQRIAGTPVSWSVANDATFAVIIDADASIKAPTVLSLPTRHYPNGVDIECGGCQVTALPGSAQLTGVPGGRITITVRRR